MPVFRGVISPVRFDFIEARARFAVDHQVLHPTLTYAEDQVPGIRTERKEAFLSSSRTGPWSAHPRQRKYWLSRLTRQASRFPSGLVSIS